MALTRSATSARNLGRGMRPATAGSIRDISAARTRRIASPEMFPEAEMLPHLICSRPILIGGANDEADQHGGA